LIYLTVIRPDLSFVVSQISQFIHVPRTPHLDAINRILRYLKGSPEKKIWMKKNNTNTIYGYSDADLCDPFLRAHSARAAGYGRRTRSDPLNVHFVGVIMIMNVYLGVF
jgi:hypothetical protein